MRLSQLQRKEVTIILSITNRGLGLTPSSNCFWVEGYQKCTYQSYMCYAMKIVLCLSQTGAIHQQILVGTRRSSFVLESSW